MNKFEIWKLMDRLAESYLQLMDARQQCSEYDIRVCEPFSDGIQICEGLGKMAQAIGQDILVDSYYSKEYPYRYYLNYKGVKFFQIGKTPEFGGVDDTDE